MATLVCHVGVAVMFCVIAWALYTSTGGVPDNTTQVQWLISNPWGIVSLVDLYVGFTVFSMWISCEPTPPHAARRVDSAPPDDDRVVGRKSVRVRSWARRSMAAPGDAFFMGHRAER